MAFQDTDDRASTVGAEETSAPTRRRPRPASTREAPIDTMMNFVLESESAATQLRGLAALFRGVFCDDEVRESEDASAAADIVNDVMKSIAGRLDANANRARATRDHLARGGAL